MPRPIISGYMNMPSVSIFEGYYIGTGRSYCINTTKIEFFIAFLLFMIEKKNHNFVDQRHTTGEK